ncbi:aminotransferase class I/II-fold pyridoxal phosphate-dependent enzyme [Metabacillus malikii]|uniref:DNA-binding transcriptional MocR family regulator n=1 Tax=Metabacillus malikii TaxID=1504265 RepID=A0ABT9ZAU5_9BACI|nr:aminotransferase class I/II-fold pyridoxal phosphate-dependent enzyme [Metabacillus malikii]MDQ0228967.1 DNA-binding transcriptional MocR family regulator [Metabacillus malikii]
MVQYSQFTHEQLRALKDELEKKYEKFKAEKLSLDMSRGKPAPAQLDLSLGLLDILNSSETLKVEENIDVRNYGVIDGIQEAKKLFADLLHVDPKQVIVGGNSSLTMMHDTITRALLHGVVDSIEPWHKLEKVKFLCPSPGYDRHFAICESLNIEMITIDMLSDGPNMNQVEELVSKDPSIKGIWCVPKYSNPEGTTYSDEVVDRLANMKTKAPDFKIFWDDAYTIHHLTDEHAQLKDILETCQKAGNPNRVFIFASTSKITFPGSGVAVMAASEDNIQFVKQQLAFQSIGPDKLNQLRHVRYFQTIDGIHHHMKRHAELIKPKFDLVLQILQTNLATLDIATWSKPKGGYFISLNTMDGCAKNVVQLAKEAGVTLTNAGATFPYGKDPNDRNIRIAPTYPTLSELETAMDVLCVCIQIASINKLLQSSK